MKAAIIDYGSGNLHSVSKACRVAMRHSPLDAVKVTHDPKDLQEATHIILPGVGAYGDCAKALYGINGMREALEREVREKGKPFLGVCVGMQLLTDIGTEHGHTQGLGWIKGETSAIRPGEGSRVPHTGWNNVEPEARSSLLKETGDAYFVHSYVVRPQDPNDVAAYCCYGEERFACALERNNIFGAQFHPEKSRNYGLALLQRFLNLT